MLAQLDRALSSESRQRRLAPNKWFGGGSGGLITVERPTRKTPIVTLGGL
jgi:hypothetical protein